MNNLVKEILTCQRCELCLEHTKQLEKADKCSKTNQGDKVIFLKNSDLIDVAKRIDNSQSNIRQDERAKVHVSQLKSNKRSMGNPADLKSKKEYNVTFCGDGI